MSKVKTWDELAPSTRAKRMGVPLAVVQNAMLKAPVARTEPVHTMAARHSRCQSGAACTGPGCRYTRKAR